MARRTIQIQIIALGIHANRSAQCGYCPQVVTLCVEIHALRLQPVDVTLFGTQILFDESWIF